MENPTIAMITDKSVVITPIIPTGFQKLICFCFDSKDF